MLDKKMELLLKITAEGQQALSVIRGVKSEAADIGKAAGLLKSHVGAVLSGIGSVAGIVLKPLELAAKVALPAAAGFAALAVKALQSRANIETLELQLQAMTGTAEDARRVLGETLSGPGVKLFSEEELIAARTALITMGQAGKQAFTTLVDAAAGSGRSLQEVLGVMATGRGTKLLGIQIAGGEEEGAKTVTYVNRLGSTIRKTAGDAKALQAVLLEALGAKYGGVGQTLTGTLRGSFQGLANAWDNMLQSFGKGAEPAAVSLIGALSDKLKGWTESGALEAFGKKVGDVLGKTIDIGKAIFSSPENFLASLDAAMKFAATAFGIYFSTLTEIFAAMAKVMAAAFGEEILQLPVIGGLMRQRGYMAKEGLTDAGGIETYRKVKTFEKLSPEAQSILLTGGQKGRTALMQEGMSQAGGALSRAGSGIASAGREFVISINNLTVKADDTTALLDELAAATCQPITSDLGL